MAFAEPTEELVDLVGVGRRRRLGIDLVAQLLEAVAHPAVVLGGDEHIAEPFAELSLEARELGIGDAIDGAVHEGLLPPLERAHSHERPGAVPFDRINRVE